MKIIGIHLERCLGCKTCELYCATERGSQGKTLLSAAGEKPLPQSRIRVEGNGQSSFPLQCRQCLEAPCLTSCLTGALERDKDSGIILIREEYCIGCWTCSAFCPYGVIFPWPEQKVALKCDRCLYMESPVCVDVCPTRALELVELQEMEGMLKSRRKETLADPTKAKEAFILNREREIER